MSCCLQYPPLLNTLRPRQNDNFPNDVFKCVFLKEKIGSFINMLLKFVLKSPIYNIRALVQIMALRDQATTYYLN